MKPLFALCALVSVLQTLTGCTPSEVAAAESMACAADKVAHPAIAAGAAAAGGPIAATADSAAYAAAQAGCVVANTKAAAP